MSFPAFFSWEQVLPSSFDWFNLPFAREFSLIFWWQKYLPRLVIGLFYLVPMSYLGSFDWFVLFSMTLAIGPDVRRWSEYETLIRATSPKLNTSSNVFVGTNSCEQVVWIYFFFLIAHAQYIKIFT